MSWFEKKQYHKINYLLRSKIFTLFCLAFRTLGHLLYNNNFYNFVTPLHIMKYNLFDRYITSNKHTYTARESSNHIKMVRLEM